MLLLKKLNNVAMFNSQPKVWYRRAINSKAFQQSNKKFVKRTHKFTWFKIISLYILATIFIFFASSLNSILYDLVVNAIIFVLFCITSYFFCYYSDLILAAEFLSAVFASAARVNTTFCLIVKNDHTVLYADQGYYGIFGQDSKGFSPLEIMLSNSIIPDNDKERFINAIEEGKHMSCILSPKSQPNDNYTINIEVIEDKLLTESVNKFNPENKDNILTVDTIYKPSGFIVIKAYNIKYMYRQHYENVFDTLHISVFTFEDNSIIYANSSFTKLLDYDLDSLREKTLNDVIENYDDNFKINEEIAIKLKKNTGDILEKRVIVNQFNTSDDKTLTYYFITN